MNNTNLPASLEDTTELRKLIVDNPDLPLIVFCGDDCWHDWYPYEKANFIQFNNTNFRRCKSATLGLCTLKAANIVDFIEFFYVPSTYLCDLRALI